MPSAPGDLGEHNCLRYREASGPQQWHFRKGGGEIVTPGIRGRMSSNDIESLLEMTLSDQGLSIFPTWMIHR